MSGVYRAPMRSRLDGVAPWSAVDRGLALGLCGVGGRLARASADLAEALVLTEVEHGERAAARLRRFADVPEGAQVWTATADGDLRHGVLLGGWTYDGSPDAHEVDLVHVRGCRWTVPDEVPAAVEQTFRRGGLNFQRITAL